MHRSEDKYLPRPKTLVFCGNSKLPENVAEKHVFGHLAIEIEVDPVTFKILNVSSTLLPSLGKKIVTDALIGHEIKDGIKSAINEIENRFFSPTKKATIAAIEDAHKRYVEYIRDKGIKREH